MSLNPRVLHASIALYREIMFGESGLSRRELLATVTSAADLSPRERALCDFAVKLTQLAAEIDEADIDALQAGGSTTWTSPMRSRWFSYFNY